MATEPLELLLHNIMNLIDNQTIISSAEASVIGMNQDATAGLSALKEAAKSTFHRLWDETDQIQAKLSVMGTNGAIAFDQHYDTILFLFRSFARGNDINASLSDVNSVCENPFAFVFGNPEHPLSVYLLEQMNPADFTPPCQYDIGEDGSVSIVE